MVAADLRRASVIASGNTRARVSPHDQLLNLHHGCLVYQREMLRLNVQTVQRVLHLTQLANAFVVLFQGERCLEVIHFNLLFRCRPAKHE